MNCKLGLFFLLLSCLQFVLGSSVELLSDQILSDTDQYEASKLLSALLEKVNHLENTVTRLKHQVHLQNRKQDLLTEENKHLTVRVSELENHNVPRKHNDTGTAIAFSAAINYTYEFAEGERVIFSEVIADAPQYTPEFAVFTVDTEGFYYFSVSALFVDSETTPHQAVAINQNREEMAIAYAMFDEAVETELLIQSGANVVVRCKVGDEIEIRVRSNAVAKLYKQTKDYTIFSGFLIYPSNS